MSGLVPERIQVMGGGYEWSGTRTYPGHGGGGYEWSGTRTYPGHGGWI